MNAYTSQLNTVNNTEPTLPKTGSVPVSASEKLVREEVKKLTENAEEIQKLREQVEKRNQK